ncbi:MAG: insulinase family protein [Clostridiales bacterium]|nr:insulinase family protein [Clostridiales bacterium]
MGETVYSETLENGLCCIVVPKKGFSKSYAFFAVNYGGCDRRFALDGYWIDTPAGVAHFLEHKMFDTEGGNALALLSSNGASPNAFTSSGITAYHFECTENFEDNLNVLLSFVSVPYFTKESVDKEQGIIAQEIKMGEDSPSRVVYQNLMKALYANNPIKDSIAGTVESIAEITPETLYHCHKVFYHPVNMVLCATGDLNPEKVCEIARAVLPESPGEIAQRDYGAEESMLPVKSIIEAQMSVSAPLFMLGSKLEPIADGDRHYFRMLMGELACMLLMGPSSPLYARLYSEGLINNRFYSGLSDFPGGVFATAGGESKNPEKVKDEIINEAERISRFGVDISLFNSLKKASIGGFLRSLDSMDNSCYALAEGHFRGYSPFNGLELLESISVEDIQAFIESAFKSERMALSIVKSKT